MVVDDNQRRRYSLNGSNPKPAAPVAGPKAPAAPAKPVNTSTFLTRIANTAIRESGAPAGSQGGGGAANPRWMQIDHSSPAANLNSRLRWVENAFKAPAPAQAPQQAQQQAPTAPAHAQQSIVAASDLKTAVGVMRKRLLSIHEQIAAFDCELAEIEKKIQ
jgi:hypothetical protein